MNNKLNRGPGTLGGRRKGVLRKIYRDTRDLGGPEKGKMWFTLRDLELRWDVSDRTILNLEEKCLIPYRIFPSRRIWEIEDILHFEAEVLKQILDSDDIGMEVENNPPYTKMKEERIERGDVYVPDEPSKFPWEA